MDGSEIARKEVLGGAQHQLPVAQQRDGESSFLGTF